MEIKFKLETQESRIFPIAYILTARLVKADVTDKSQPCGKSSILPFPTGERKDIMAEQPFMRITEQRKNTIDSGFP